MKKLITLSLMMGILSGCSTGTLISKEGTTENPKWHVADVVIFNKDQGTFPNLQGLKQVQKGMTKDQLYELIGRPQYDDGWRSKEWNYLFHFNTPGQGENNVTTCQFKVLFDQNTLAGNFYWNPITPKDGVCPPNLKPVVADVKPSAPVKRYKIGSDALFEFDKSSLNDLNVKGRQDLDNLVSELKNLKEVTSIHVLGYTDRLGTDAYNLTLSQNRANTIKQYLIQQGVRPSLITAQGFGKSNEVQQCDGKLSRAELINCLKANRRIEIDVNGYGE